MEEERSEKGGLEGLVGDSIMIGGYDRIQGSQNDFKVATVFGNLDLIILWKTPKIYWNIFEGEIEEILAHESLHILLANFLTEQASVAFDRVCPTTRSMQNVWRKLGRTRAHGAVERWKEKV